MAEVEKLENHIITRGAAVRAEEVGLEKLKRNFADSANFARLPNMERVRVTIEGCRPIACGGTHLRNVSEARGVRFGKAEQVGEGFAALLRRFLTPLLGR